MRAPGGNIEKIGGQGSENPEIPNLGEIAGPEDKNPKAFIDEKWENLEILRDANPEIPKNANLEIPKNANLEPGRAISQDLGKIAMLGVDDRDERAISPERREKLSRGIKVVIGGPPHSGKSVFVNALQSMLDPNSTYLMSANPDGEGAWLQLGYDDKQVANLRRKGNFTPDFVDFVSKNVRDWDATKVLLVDVGGIPSAENAKIIEGATHAIILAGTSEKADASGVVRPSKHAFIEMQKWQEFFQNNGLEVIAKVHSDYTGMSDTSLGHPERVVASVHHLERGQNMDNRKTIREVADKITALAEQNTFYRDEKNTLKTLLQEAPRIPDYTFVYNFKERDPVTGRPQQVINALSGEPVRRPQLGYKPEAARYIHDLPDEQIAAIQEFSGPAPKWVYAALTAKATDIGSPKPIYSRGYTVPQALAISESPLPNYSVEERGLYLEHPVVFVTETTIGQSGRQITPDVLTTEKLPDIPEGAIVVFSSQGPNWFDASVMLGYREKAFAFAEYQPRNRANPEGRDSAIICDSREAEYLGRDVLTELREEAGKEAITENQL